ncbi:MAG: magnesium-translocating P-type ATPase [Zoogloeaceae bacterium]|jgi:Mg2+-importing ATPase|nr:magnesium-translocating P-type ATPase [Zoogloeaceae bacterium]
MRHFVKFRRLLAAFSALMGGLLRQEVKPQPTRTPSADALAALAAAGKSAPEALLSTFGSRLAGLSAEEAKTARARFGPNEIAHAQTPGWARRLWESAKTPFNLLLAALAAVSFCTGDLTGFTVIGTMVALSILIRFWQEQKSLRATAQLKAMIRRTAQIARPGKGRVKLPVQQLVPGDIVFLSAGDLVPADCRLLQATNLLVDESSFTGESMPAEKRVAPPALKVDNPLEFPNLAFMGTEVVSGSAKALVVATGERACFGRLARQLAEADRLPTHFQMGVNSVSWLLIRFMFVMAPLVFFINGFVKRDWTDALFFAMSIAVGLTPEMLPMIVTSTLAKGALALSRKKVVVKRLDAIQNFGAMDVLCTDKTGTLTEDKIELADCLDAQGRPAAQLLELAVLNSALQTGLDNPLDAAVLEAAKPDGLLEAVRRAWQPVGEIPFDFQRRRMSVAAEKDGQRLLVSKGAVEEMLAACAFVRRDGADAPLDADERARLRALAEQLGRDGLRAVVVAQKTLSAEQTCFAVADETDLTLCGFLAFRDPPKASAAKAIAALVAHGVAVKVLTGDAAPVAARVCAEVGIDVGAGVLTGAAIDKLDDAALDQAAARHAVFARLSPEHKARIVRTLKRAGHVVGFLGDGINDAPALREADVGISVNSAADIARDASDLILLEKSLMVLEQGVVEGRVIFANMLKYIRMTASSNFGNVFSVLAASAFIPFLPMLPMHLLIQNLLYDISQTAIPFDNVDPELLLTPQRWNPEGIGRFMLCFGPISSVFDIATYVIMWFVFSANDAAHQTLFQSGWFVVGLLTQTLIVHMIRTPKIPFLQSRAAKPVLIMTVVIMAVGIFLPMGPLAADFKLEALPLSYFPILAALLVGYATLTQAIKTVYVRKFGWS